MRAKAVLLLTMLIGLLASFAYGQGADYKLQPQDVIRIQVLEVYAGQINDVLPIGRDGTISAPYVGSVMAAGKTTDQLETELSQLYEQKLKIRDPHVAVTIEQYRTIQASAIGLVKLPGVYDFRPGDTVMTLLSKAGGVDTDNGDLRHATLKKKDSRELIPIDLHAMLFLEDMSQNYPLEDGDELNVPELTNNRILILGAIAAPGPYEYREPMHLADAIAMAKGPIPVRSMLSKVLIVREEAGRPGQYQRIQANFVRFVRNGDSSQNVLLQPGDMIYITETRTPDFNQILSTLASVAYLFSARPIF